MSVNITVNGRFAKHCKPHSLLQDPVKAKKDEEEARRKLRLLQVREQSKKFAEKIRNDVKEALHKEKLKYEATKAKEFECWRDHAMQENMKDNRAAVFQIGTAHKAAEKENREQMEKKEAKKATYKQFRKQMAARRKNKENLNERGPCICNKINVRSKSQFQCKCAVPEVRKASEPQKRKRDSCLSSCDSDSTSDEETSNDDTLDNESTLSSCVMPSATTASSCHNRATQTSIKCPTTNLKKTPAVFLDVEVGSEDSIVISAPAEVKDTHSEYNRQYSSVIRISPRKSRKTQDDKQVQVETRTPSISSEQTTEKLLDANKTSDTASNIQPKARATRFTLISDLVKKQQTDPVTAVKTFPSPTKIQTFPDCYSKTSPNKARATISSATRPPVSRPLSSQPITPKVSPRKGSAVSSKSSQFVATGHQKRPSISTSALSGNTLAVGSVGSNSGRVQFYDYNSKLCKDGDQERANVTVNRQMSTNQLSAMDQANLENHLQQERHQDMLEKHKQIEERGQKALEREQVRRDCNDLTEKLEALTRQYPRQLPTSDNSPHIFVDKQLRKEGKMNAAVEKLLSRPSIITCSEVNHRNTDTAIKTTTKLFNANNQNGNEINVGLTASHLPAKDVSSDSCCSILLGYVDDQSRQVRRDIEEWPNGSERNDKQNRLRNLLKRLDQMRDALVQELQLAQKDVRQKEHPSAKDERCVELIDLISKCRQEREDIMIDTIVHRDKNDKHEKQTNSNKQNYQGTNKQHLEKRERELQLKEDILEKKVREFYELQKQQKKQKSSSKVTDQNSKEQLEKGNNNEVDAESKATVNCSALETPVEIVITVKGETKCITIPGKSKHKTPYKRKPTTVATLMKSPQPARKLTPKKKAPGLNKPKPSRAIGRQNSYDSNSTSYMSLPSQIPNTLGNIVDNMQQRQEQQPNSTTDDTQTSLEFEVEKQRRHHHKEPVKPINPLVAQYIQRLLGMSRKAVQRLCVSSSDIETPSTSLINTTENLMSSESLASDERLALVESFMQENRSFIKELEQSMRHNNNSNMENSMKIMDDIWQKRLKEPKKQRESKTREQAPAASLPGNKKSASEIQKRYKEKLTPLKPQEKEIIERGKCQINEKPLRERSVQTNLSKKTAVVDVRIEDADTSSDALPQVTQNPHHRRIEKVEKAVGTRTSADSTKTEADSQIARYAQLTENCTHRIAELTELISRVRQEKQKLLEVTLSSVSDNGRQSTEYLELPNAKCHTSNEHGETSATSSSDDAKQIKKTSTTSEITNPMPKLSALEKNRHITASQDSGIAESRPITALENRQDPEPISHTSTESQAMNMNTQQRKLKPPPVLRRFSPQFQEDELVHELSTILEVDTPANSRINTAVAQTSAEDRLTAPEPIRQAVVMFPTFKEYCQQQNLDITLLDKEQSCQLQHEFSLYIEDLQKSRRTENPLYKEFPSMNEFMSSTKAEHLHHDTITDETLGQMRINSIQFEKFPDVKGYVQQQRNKSNATSSPNDEPKMLDTESLENITDLRTNSNTDDTASLDIEDELKRRNILKSSFRYSQNKPIFSSTAHQDGEFYVVAESGVEKLSTSDNTMSMLEADMKRLVRQWPTRQGSRNKSQVQYATLSSTTTTSTKETTSAKERNMKSPALEESNSTELGRPLNLHDFLKRELLKHTNLSDSTTTSSSDFSLRSQFLYSLIGTLTPGATTTKSGQQTLERQKTSTPVPMHSSHTQTTHSSHLSRASSSSQLFSGESRISSVHMADHSNRLQNTSEGVNGDQSSI